MKGADKRKLQTIHSLCTDTQYLGGSSFVYIQQGENEPIKLRTHIHTEVRKARAGYRAADGEHFAIYRRVKSANAEGSTLTRDSRVAVCNGNQIGFRACSPPLPTLGGGREMALKGIAYVERVQERLRVRMLSPHKAAEKLPLRLLALCACVCGRPGRFQERGIEKEREPLAMPPIGMAHACLRWGGGGGVANIP